MIISQGRNKSKVYVFFTLIFFLFITTVNAQWIQKGIDIDGEAQDDESGRSLAVNSDGNTVAIGAIGNDDGAVEQDM